MSVEDSPHPLPAGQEVRFPLGAGRHAVGAARLLERAYPPPLGGAGRAGRAVPVETFSPGLGPTRRSTVCTNRILPSTLATRPRS